MKEFNLIIVLFLFILSIFSLSAYDHDHIYKEQIEANYRAARLSYTEEEINAIKIKLDGLGKFSKLDKSQIIKESVDLKSELEQIGITNGDSLKDSDPLMDGITLASLFISENLIRNPSYSFFTVQKIIKGRPDDSFEIMRKIKDKTKKQNFSLKYGNNALFEFYKKLVAPDNANVDIRINILKEMVKDLRSVLKK